MKKKITFIVPVCSRGQKWKSATECPLITKYLASAVKTILPEDYDKYDFHCKFGFDHDDAFFLNEHNIDTIKKSFIAMALEGNRIEVSYHAFDDTKHNPVQCWNNLAKLAVEEGADYLYQTGDDVELQTPGWVDKFVDALESTDNVGVAAPKDLGYHGLYTQSFVHKTHLEIMGSYYPSAFRSWYCDDFITGVYKHSYSHYLEDCHIKNTGGPQRYQAHDAQPILVEEVARGQKKLWDCLTPDMNEEEKNALYGEMRSVHTRYEEIAKTMTTAPAKPFWSTATKIFEGLVNG
jgi:hypothetical protein